MGKTEAEGGADASTVGLADGKVEGCMLGKVEGAVVLVGLALGRDKVGTIVIVGLLLVDIASVGGDEVFALVGLLLDDGANVEGVWFVIHLSFSALLVPSLVSLVSLSLLYDGCHDGSDGPVT